MNEYDDELDVLEEDEAAYSLNGKMSEAELDESLRATIDAEMRRFEELPQFVRFFTSHDIDDLKVLSEIPRRLVMPMVAVDMAIEAGTLLNKRLLERAMRSEERYREKVREFDEALLDAHSDGKVTKAEAERLAALSTRIEKMKKRTERHIMVAQRQRKEAAERRSMLERYRKSFLQYMRGVDRKGSTELLELWAAMGSEDDAKEVNDDE